MAQIYIGLNAGADVTTALVQEGSSTNSTDVELRIDNTKNLTRKEVEKIVHTFMRYLKDGVVQSVFNNV